MTVNSKVLENCSCSVLSTKSNVIFEKPHVYISYVQTFISNYRFHYKYEHCEDSISQHFVTKFICSVIDILNSFRKQVLFFDQHVAKPLRNVDQLSTTIQVCGDMIGKVNRQQKIGKEVLIELLNFMKEIFDKWESYVFQNGILTFV